MTNHLISSLPDGDMQAAPKALLRAAQRAREIAQRTNTPLVLVRDGVLVEEYVTGDDTDSDDGPVDGPAAEK